MFFGGFSGATAFYPNKLANSSFVPRTVLTDFRLSGNSVPIAAGSALKQSITVTDSITLSHQQNIFSIEFSALSFFNAETNRYRYKLDGLDKAWHEVGSDQRIANYTTLPRQPTPFRFREQPAAARGVSPRNAPHCYFAGLVSDSLVSHYLRDCIPASALGSLPFAPQRAQDAVQRCP